MQGVRKGVGEECTVLVFSDEIEQQKNVCASIDLLLLLSTELNSLRGTQGHSGWSGRSVEQASRVLFVKSTLGRVAGRG